MITLCKLFCENFSHVFCTKKHACIKNKNKLILLTLRLFLSCRHGTRDSGKKNSHSIWTSLG